MQLTVKFVVAITLFIAFSIGLNLGLHGILLFDTPDGNLKNDKTEVGRSTIKFSNLDPLFSANEATVKHPRSITIKPSVVTTNKPSEIIHSEVITLNDKLRTVSGKIDIKKHDAMKKYGMSEDTIFTENNRIPIVLLTCNRPQLLQNTIESLLKVRGVAKDQILISQDGTMKEISDIAEVNSISIVQNVDEGNRLRGRDGGARIAMHYKYSLTTAFDKFPTAPALIVIEDDLLFSPDFYEYFQAVAPILNHDKSTFVVSAWSDNGFKGKVRDKLALRRTDYFPGLGWMLSRSLYKNELESIWPREHWDHWLRSASVNKNREIVFPEVPRSFHNGIKGTFMNQETHNRYFRDIDYNLDSSTSWIDVETSADQNPPPIFLQADSDVYEYRIEQLIKQCQHINDINELTKFEEEILCLWIDVNPVSEWQPPEFQPISEFFGLWHEHRRGSHRGLHEFYFMNNYVLLLNIRETKGGGISKSKSTSGVSYSALKPSNAKILPPSSFDKNILLTLRRRGVGTSLNVYKAESTGMSCDQVCSKVSKKCNLGHLQLLNSCDVIEKHFSCGSCRKSIGADQPVYVSPDAAREFGPGDCLVNSLYEHTTCEASHHATFRLCSCS